VLTSIISLTPIGRISQLFNLNCLYVFDQPINLVLDRFRRWSRQRWARAFPRLSDAPGAAE